MSTLSMQKFRTSLFAAVLAVLPLSPALHAQTAQPLGRFNVPFEFDTADHHFTAGRYSIYLQATNVVSIRGGSGAWFAMMALDGAAKPSKTSKLVFRRYGNRYLLCEIWTTGDTVHLERIKSKAERRLQLAKDAPASDSVEVALLEATSTH